LENIFPIEFISPIILAFPEILVPLVKFLDQLHDKLVTIYCDKTKKSKEEIKLIMKNET
jgi:hypothetical protein